MDESAQSHRHGDDEEIPGCFECADHEQQGGDLGCVVQTTGKADGSCAEEVQGIHRLFGLNAKQAAVITALALQGIPRAHRGQGLCDGKAPAALHGHPFLAHADASFCPDARGGAQSLEHEIKHAARHHGE